MEIKNPDLISGIFWGIVGLLFSVWSFTYPLWSLHQPGPGLFPLVLGILLIFLSFVLLLGQVRKRFLSKEKVHSLSMPGGWKRVAYAVFVLLLAIFLFEKMGYLLTFFLLIISLMLGEGFRNRKTLLLLGLIGALGVYFIFVLLLKQELPRGFLGI